LFPGATTIVFVSDLRRVWISKLNVPANCHELPAAEKFKLISLKMFKLQPNNQAAHAPMRV
jgi:hypothetical protein